MLETISFEDLPDALFQHIVLDFDFGVLLGILQPMCARHLHKLMFFLFDFGGGRALVSRLFVICWCLGLRSGAVFEPLRVGHCLNFVLH